MTHAEEVCRWIDVTLTEAQIAAARYLETVGYRFLIDFGYDNACALAKRHWLNAPVPGRKH